MRAKFGSSHLPHSLDSVGALCGQAQKQGVVARQAGDLCQQIKSAREAVDDRPLVQFKDNESQHSSSTTRVRRGAVRGNTNPLIRGEIDVSINYCLLHGSVNKLQTKIGTLALFCLNSVPSSISLLSKLHAPVSLWQTPLR